MSGFQVPLARHRTSEASLSKTRAASQLCCARFRPARTTKAKLGRLKRVDLRDYWEQEDSDFTPWLASEENIALRGEAIGMELEVQQGEASVGPSARTASAGTPAVTSSWRGTA